MTNEIKLNDELKYKISELLADDIKIDFAKIQEALDKNPQLPKVIDLFYKKVESTNQLLEYFKPTQGKDWENSQVTKTMMYSLFIDTKNIIKPEVVEYTLDSALQIANKNIKFLDAFKANSAEHIKHLVSTEHKHHKDNFGRILKAESLDVFKFYEENKEVLENGSFLITTQNNALKLGTQISDINLIKLAAEKIKEITEDLGLAQDKITNLFLNAKSVDDVKNFIDIAKNVKNLACGNELINLLAGSINEMPKIAEAFQAKKETPKAEVTTDKVNAIGGKVLE